ncbi:MAG: response regulator [Candidatus Omnitrophica bacterium]|nr:response regulator [Candidatus Omnitrophota bacterium]
MGGKILMIDDDPDLIESVTAVLEAKGYEVASAQDGERGVAKAKEFMPDLILLDVMMTRKTEGMDVSHRLHDDQRLRDIPVIVVTGVRSQMGVSFKFEPDETWFPVKAVLEKPVKPDRLLAVIAQHIKRQ